MIHVLSKSEEGMVGVTRVGIKVPADFPRNKVALENSAGTFYTPRPSLGALVHEAEAEGEVRTLTNIRPL